MEFFPPIEIEGPQIYGYTELNEEYKGLIKVGFTQRSISVRMKEHYPTKSPEGIEKFKILFVESSVREDGSYFEDKLVHRIMEDAGIECVGGEWFRCNESDVKAAIVAARSNKKIDKERTQDFQLRPEHRQCIIETKKYFDIHADNPEITPHYLWNCKMMFGKNFTAYKIAIEMKWTRVLILTFKPAVQDSWENDLLSHQDFKDWEFIKGKTQSLDDCDPNKSVICFASLQDFLGKTKSGGIKTKNKWANTVNWDCIILDEYHWGAWNDRTKAYISEEDKIIFDEEKVVEKESGIKSCQDDWDEELSPLKTKNYLYLSGTPFRAISTGEFLETQIFNWTYADEQKAKLGFKGTPNPYASLPKMVMLTYKMPDELLRSAGETDFNEFDLNEFFKADGDGENAKFKHEDFVQKWLELIRGSGINNFYNSIKSGRESQYFPFQDTSIKNIINHTFWFLPSVASCYAMRNLLLSRANSFYHEYQIIVAAGSKAGIGVDALKPVRKAMGTNLKALKTKTITLSCGKLKEGVTVKPWTGVFMLRNTKTPESYFQVAFRVQSPWSVKENGMEVPIKNECYVFDFAPNRALSLVSEYCNKLVMDDGNLETRVEEFLRFLPVLGFDGSFMSHLDPLSVLDWGSSGTSGSQLARKFESARLINLQNNVLQNILDDKESLDIIMQIEGFRDINSDIEKILNKSKKIKDLKTKSTKEDLNKEEKKKLSLEQRERLSIKQQIQKKLLQFSSRLPIFMYLTDFREETLMDVILKIESGLFKKVTSISKKQFEVLISKGAFNSSIMNANVRDFRIYEDASLKYTGFTKHEIKDYGLWDTKITKKELKSSF